MISQFEKKMFCFLPNGADSSFRVKMELNWKHRCEEMFCLQKPAVPTFVPLVGIIASALKFCHDHPLIPHLPPRTFFLLLSVWGWFSAPPVWSPTHLNHHGAPVQTQSLAAALPKTFPLVCRYFSLCGSLCCLKDYYLFFFYPFIHYT